MSLLALRARAAAAAFACSGGGICRAATKPSIQAVLPEPTALGASMRATRMWPGKASSAAQHTAGASWVAGSGPKASSGATAACQNSSAEAVASSPGSSTKASSGASWIAGSGPKAASGPTAACRNSSTDAGSSTKASSGASWVAGSGPKASSGAKAGKPAAPSPASAGHLNANKGGISWQAGPKPSSGATSGKPAAPAGPLNTNKGAVKTDAATLAITGGPIGVSWVAGRTNKSTPTGLSILFDKGAAGSHGCSRIAGSLRKHLPTVNPSSLFIGSQNCIARSFHDISYSSGAPPPRKFRLFLASICMVGGLLILANAPDESDDDILDGVLHVNLDWAALGYTPPVFGEFGDNPNVRFGLKCGFCWALVSVQAAESANRILNGDYTRFSVQQILDCVPNQQPPGRSGIPFSCSGGFPDVAFRYMMDVGLTTADLYPLKVLQGGCQLKGKPIVFRLKGFVSVNNSERDYKRALQKSPIVVSIYVNDNFRKFYGESIIDFAVCPPNPDGRVNHAVLLVGYDKDIWGNKYWIIQNMWGKKWGKNGFAKVRRGGPDKRGVLGITAYPGWQPVVQKRD